MSYSDALKIGACELYVRRGWSVRQIADDLDLAPSTVLRWSRAGGWERERTAARERILAESEEAAAVIAVDLECSKLMPRLIRTLTMMTDRYEAMLEGRLPGKRVPFDFSEILKAVTLVSTYYSLVRPAKLGAELRALQITEEVEI